MRGRTSVSKNKSKLNDIGIKRLTHTYVDVLNDGYEISNHDELESLQKRYQSEGVSNLYIIRLIVNWINGDMHEWVRNVFHVEEENIQRKNPSGRMNRLSMPLGAYQSVEHLQGVYGEEVVKATVCEIVMVGAHEKRVCLGTMAAST